MARLMLPDAATGAVKDHGPHAFIVQVRGARADEWAGGLMLLQAFEA